MYLKRIFAEVDGIKQIPEAALPTDPESGKPVLPANMEGKVTTLFSDLPFFRIEAS